MKRTRFALLVWLCLTAGAKLSTLRAQTPSGSDYLEARPVAAHILYYDYKGGGTLMPKINWGLDLAWCWDRNFCSGRNYLNLFNKNVSLVRVSFQPAWALNGTSLSNTHLTGVTNTPGLTERLRVLATLGTSNSIKPQIFLNCDPATGIISSFKGSGTSVVNNWVNLIKATGQYIENQGYTVTGIAPFNEPDYSQTGYPSASVMNDICYSLKNDSWSRNKNIMAGNVLNPDYALSWYNPCKSNITEGNTHQLAGTFDNYVGFMQQVRNDGKRVCQDELHNVMEAIIGANYGMVDGIWWGSSEHARTQFCRANDGTGYRLAYWQDAATFTAATVYRNTQDGVVEAFMGCSERQATETSYGFVSKDRDVYYDGYGPTREFYMHLPADPNGRYQGAGQKNAERVINIQSGEDVQPFPTEGTFQIMNMSNGRVITGYGTNAAYNAANVTVNNGTGADGQGWRITAMSEDIGGDYSYYSIALANTQNNTYYLDDLDWSYEDGQRIIIYAGGASGCEQWYFVYAGDGSFYIHNRYSNLCLDLNGSSLVQRTRTNATSQKWKLVPSNITPDRTAPATPSGLTATNLQAAVKLSWNANSENDLRGYYIVRTVQGANDWVTIARNVTGTTYIDNTVIQGKAYTYKIKAMDRCCNFSAASATVNGQPTATQGLVAQWEFDGNTRDKTTNQLNAAVRNSDYTGNCMSGSNALTLNGSTNYVQLPYSVSTMPTMTVCAWVYWNGGNAWQRIFDFGNGEDAYLFLSPSNNNNQMVFEIKANGTTQNFTTNKLTTGTWKHIAVTIAKNNVKLYVDGAQVAANTSITLTPSDVAGVCNYLGRSQFTGDPLFNGRLDDARIYNYVLSQSEIQSIYNNSEVTEETDWIVGGSYYFYNMDAGMFLTEGNSWGTQASLSSEGMLWSISQGSTSNLYRLSRAGHTDFLFADNIGSMYVDGVNKADDNFAMTLNATTGLTAITMDPNGTYSTANYGASFVGWAGDLGNTTVSPVLKSTDNSNPGNQLWRIMSGAEYERLQAGLANTLAARQAMWPILQMARANAIDCSAAETVYYNLEATTAQINAARTALENTCQAYIEDNASDTHPVDVSYLISHNGCGDQNFAGWTQEGGWTSQTAGPRNGNTVLTGRFFESWVAGPGTLSEKYLTQTISGLPAGNYRLTADVIATQQSDANATVTGVYLTVNNQNTAFATTGVPQTVSAPDFTVEANGSVTFGVAITNGNTANWVAVDNFRLFYLGDGEVQPNEDITGKSYYLYNMDAGMFLTQGNAWGTQASLSSTGISWAVSSGGNTGRYRLSRTGYFNYLFADNLGAMYVDGTDKTDILAITTDSETHLTIISMDPDGIYGTNAYGTSYVGWDGDLGQTTVSPVLKPTDHSKPGILQWRLMTSAEYNTYQAALANALSARQAMWPTLQMARANAIDCSAAEAVYYNIEATAAQINAARTTLEATYQALIASASESNPVEVTYRIANAGFGTDPISGWTLTNTWGLQTAGYRNGDAVMSGRFIESWVAGPGTLADRSFTQTLSNLPAGKYRIAADVIATQQSDASVTVSGITLTINDQTATCASGNGSPASVLSPIVQVAEGASLAVGLAVSSTTANWVAIDNFRLFYLGGALLLGDVDDDGDLDYDDVWAIVQHILGRTPQKFNRQAADVNNDNRITLADVTALINSL